MSNWKTEKRDKIEAFPCAEVMSGHGAPKTRRYTGQLNLLFNV